MYGEKSDELLRTDSDYAEWHDLKLKAREGELIISTYYWNWKWVVTQIISLQLPENIPQK